MSNVFLPIEDLVGKQERSTVRWFISSIRAAGHSITSDGKLMFESEPAANTLSPLLKKRCDLGLAFIESANAHYQVRGWAYGNFIKTFLRRIIDGQLESGTYPMIRWLLRRRKSAHVHFLRGFLTKRGLIPEKLPDIVEQHAKGRDLVIEGSRWEGLHEDDQAIMRAYLCQIHTRNPGRTPEGYKYAFNYLAGLMQSSELTRLSEVRSEHVHLLLERMGALKLKRGTQAHVLACVRQLYYWLIEERGFLHCPVTKRHFPKFDKPQPNPLSHVETRAIRRVLDSQFAGSMERAFFYVVYLSGLRPFEARSIRLSDICRDGADLFIARGKGNKTGYVPIAKYAIERIDEWLAKSPLSVGTDYVFHTNGLQIGRRQAEQMRREIVRICNVPFKWRQLRTTFATRLAEFNVNEFVIQRLLRHTRLNTIMNYVAFPDSQVRQSYAKLADKLLESPSESEPAFLGTSVALIDSQDHGMLGKGELQEAFLEETSTRRPHVGRSWRKPRGPKQSKLRQAGQVGPSVEPPIQAPNQPDRVGALP